MATLVFAIVRPQTAFRRCALLRLFYGLRSFDGQPLVGPVTDFHSYTWQEPLGATWRTLDESLKSDEERRLVYLWWDVFCQNQHDVGDVKV
jgi:hypothetical protein